MHQMVHFDQCEYREVFLPFICLCKRLDFKVKQMGLMSKYRSDADFKMRMKKLAALAFTPLVCQFTKSYRIDLRTMSFPSSHTLKANGLGTALADGDVALYLTFH